VLLWYRYGDSDSHNPVLDNLALCFMVYNKRNIRLVVCNLLAVQLFQFEGAIMELLAEEKACLEYCSKHFFPTCEHSGNCEIQNKAKGIEKKDNGIWKRIVESIRK
jgi:hypothetical protein